MVAHTSMFAGDKAISTMGATRPRTPTKVAMAARANAIKRARVSAYPSQQLTAPEHSSPQTTHGSIPAKPVTQPSDSAEVSTCFFSFAAHHVHVTACLRSMKMQQAGCECLCHLCLLSLHSVTQSQLYLLSICTDISTAGSITRTGIDCSHQLPLLCHPLQILQLILHRALYVRLSAGFAAKAEF